MLSATTALREHWPEYLIEGWALGTFMVSVGVCATLFFSPVSPVYAWPAIARTVLFAAAMGLTTVLLIQSPWAKRSGAHMNPAVTLAFLRLRKIHPWDSFFFVVAQTVGGILGVLLVAWIAKDAFTRAPVNYAVTLPGAEGVLFAFAAEAALSFFLMLTVLEFSSRKNLARFTGLAVGCLLTVFISVELPISGTSMNPARSFASAAPDMMWRDFWLYLLAPPLGMVAAAQLHLIIRPNTNVCAKLLHPDTIRCIHCGRGGPSSA